jgi:sec-independent protein translocase protein TatA
MLTGHLPELLIVLTLALVVFGPKRIPEIGSSLGQGIRHFKQGVSHLEDDLTPHDLAESVEPHPITPIVSDHKAS